MKISEAYKQLDLENPIKYQKKILDIYAKKIRNQNEDVETYKESFILLRRTGKTTYKCVRAAVEMINGRHILFITRDDISKKYTEEKIQEILKNLTKDQEIKELGRLDVVSKLSSNVIQKESYLKNLSIIVDIY